MRKRNIVYGVYYPNCFTINIREFKFPEECKAGQPGFRTYIHEHVHYIQDIAFLNGICRIDWFLRAICGFSRIGFHNEPIYIPYNRPENKAIPENAEIIQKAIEDIESSIRWSDQTEGDLMDELGNRHIRSININRGTYSIPLDGEATPHPRVSLEIEDDANDVHHFNFGAAAIEEGMAYAVESLVFNSNTLDIPDFPYKVSEWVANKLIEGDPISAENLVLFSDMSLQTDVPGVTFIELCHKYGRDINFCASPIEERATILLDCVRNVYDPNGLFNIVSKDLCSLIDEFGETVPEFQRALYWVCDTARKAYEVRQSDPAAFLKIYLKTTSPSTIDYTEDFPVPLIIDCSSAPYSQGNYDEFIHALMFLSLQSIYDAMISSGDFHCQMYDWCQMPFKDSDCQSRSYLKANRFPEKTCHLGLAAMRLGFYKKTVIFR